MLLGATELDAKGKYTAPGLIDIQINGFLGVDFSDQGLTINDLHKATKALWKVGVTTFLPTVITNGQRNLRNSFSILSGALEDAEIGLSIPGFHLEGPYISPVQGFRGAHLEKYIRQPDWERVFRIAESGPRPDQAHNYCTGGGGGHSVYPQMYRSRVLPSHWGTTTVQQKRYNRLPVPGLPWPHTLETGVPT